MDVIRKELSDSELLGIPARYDPDTDTVQVSDDGGETWHDGGSDFDPRLRDLYEPPASPCDAAARMIAALDEITNALADSLAGGAVAADLGAVILAWLALFAGFGILALLAVLLAAAIVSVGSSNISTAYNNMPWDDMLCELSRLLGTDTALTDDDFAAFQTWCANELTADQQTLLNGALLIAGRGGLNNFAATRGETGDCSDCTEYFCIFLPDLFAGITPQLTTCNGAQNTWYWQFQIALNDTGFAGIFQIDHVSFDVYFTGVGNPIGGQYVGHDNGNCSLGNLSNVGSCAAGLQHYSINPGWNSGVNRIFILMSVSNNQSNSLGFIGQVRNLRIEGHSLTALPDHLSAFANYSCL